MQKDKICNECILDQEYIKDLENWNNIMRNLIEHISDTCFFTEDIDEANARLDKHREWCMNALGELDS